MPDSPDLEEIIATNPKVDRDQLNEERELLRSMRRRRTRGARYNLVLPGSGRRVLAGDDPARDPRTVNLPQRQ